MAANVKNSSAMQIAFIAGILLIVAMLILNSQSRVINTNQFQQNAVSVSADSIVETEPDKAEIYVKIETFAEKASDAKNENSKISDSVRKALKGYGIKDADMETSSFFLNPKYRYDPDSGESTLEGYTLTNVIKVTTKDVNNAGRIVDASVDAGANGIDFVRFGLSKEKEKEISGQALGEAAKSAKDKASILAKSLGVSLGKVISIQESSFSIMPYDYSPMKLSAEAAVRTEISPQKVEVTAHVAVAYEIA